MALSAVKQKERRSPNNKRRSIDISPNQRSRRRQPQSLIPAQKAMRLSFKLGYELINRWPNTKLNRNPVSALGVSVRHQIN